MNKETKNSVIFIIFYVAIMFYIFFSTSYIINTNKKISKYEEEIVNLHISIEDLYLETECYSDNYIALWTTVNELEERIDK